MESTRHTGGLKEFDDSTTMDLPYKCKHCGQYIKIENRQTWLHDCIDKNTISEKINNKWELIKKWLK